MGNSSILDLVEQRTRELVAERLRSTSIVIARLEALIAEANRLGHSHAEIHARLRAGGLESSWNTYRVSLVRIRKRTSLAPGAALNRAGLLRNPVSGQEAAAQPEVRTQISPAIFSPVSSPTHVLDALAGAKQVASRDYAQIARDLHRKSRK